MKKGDEVQVIKDVIYQEKQRNLKNDFGKIVELNEHEIIVHLHKLSILLPFSKNELKTI